MATGRQRTETGPDGRGQASWWEGAALALASVGAFLIAVGPTTEALGGWAPRLWITAAVLSFGHGLVYGALARASPTLAGGLPVYAVRAWAGHGRRIAAVTTVGYWFAWASVPVVFGRGLGNVMGELAAAGAQLPQAAPWVWDRAIPLLLVVLFATIQLLGLTTALHAGRYLGLGLLVAAAVAALALSLDMRPVAAEGTPVVRTDIARTNLEPQELLAWLYLMCWTTYAIEVAAVIAPRYRDPARDPMRATGSVALLLLALAMLVPGGLLQALGFGLREPGLVIGVAATGGQMAALVVAAGLGAGLLLGINAALIDSAVALAHLADEGVAPRWLAEIGSRGAPVRSVGVVLVLDVFLIGTTPSLIAVMAVGNLGYLLAHIIALAGAARAVSNLSIAARRLAAILALLDVCIVSVGAISFRTTGYGGMRELGMAAGVLLGGLAVVLVAERGAGRQPPQ